MFKGINRVIVLLLAGCSSPLYAGDVAGTVITKLQINKSLGDVLFIAVDKAKDSMPACHTNSSWTYALQIISDGDKRIYAMLLAARASQTPVTLSGSGTCDAFGTIESLQGAGY